MRKRVVLGILTAVLAVGFSAQSAFAFRCPKLIAAGRRLAANASGDMKSKAIVLLNEAEASHKGATSAKGHVTAMQKATDAVAMLTSK
ncbi:MAG: hypothetical protein QF451_02240 [Nitrospinota bacterium]|nr:hypothetical protein [Nitrospinota bacterium]